MLPACQSVGPPRNISTTIGWINMKFCTNIHGPQKMNPKNFGDPLTFPLAPPSDQNFNMSNTLIRDIRQPLPYFVFSVD